MDTNQYCDKDHQFGLLISDKECRKESKELWFKTWESAKRWRDTHPTLIALPIRDVAQLWGENP